MDSGSYEEDELTYVLLYTTIGGEREGDTETDRLTERERDLFALFGF